MKKGKAIGIAVGCAAVCLVAAVLVRGSGGPRTNATSEPAWAPEGLTALAALVRDVHAAWHPRDRERAVAAAVETLPELESAVVWVLEQPDHELFVPTAELAGACQLDAALQPLAEAAVAGPAATRVVSMAAAERIRPWSDEELLVILDDEQSDVVVAGLKIVGTRPSRPLAALLPLLGSEDPVVREAALHAMPSTLASEDVGRLLRRLDAGGEEGETALRALAQCAWTDEIVGALWDRFPRLSGSAQETILEACVQKAYRPEAVGAVWDVAFGDADPELRARALQCLEIAGGYDVGALREALPDLPDRLRYYGARCLVRSGDPRGVETLLDLAEQPGVGGEDRLAAKELLAWLSGRPLHLGVGAWREWYEGMPSPPPPAALPPAPF